MESLSPQVVSATKLPILNHNEFDLWKMRIEQYFLMTDYSLWEVILNGDSPIPARVIDGKGFSGVDTPLFEGMIVAQQADDVANEGVVGFDVDVVPVAANVDVHAISAAA
uniref:Ribonuclease H-like domain-containing protein n=1 Tax=Tanacetum cinerariifolium TaxID=118510 RepID=A0A6L2LEQ5_TANCI|nr:ribonuclease H-like domain-containing protein [Tanacetum cinerariifolium]